MRLLIGTSAATAVVLTLLGLAIYFSMWRSLLSEFDGGLLTQAQALGSMVEQHGRRLKFEFDAQQMPEFNAGRRPEYFEIRFDGGKVLARSNSLGKDNLAAGASSSAALRPARAGEHSSGPERPAAIGTAQRRPKLGVCLCCGSPLLK